MFNIFKKPKKVEKTTYYAGVVGVGLVLGYIPVILVGPLGYFLGGIISITLILIARSDNDNVAPNHQGVFKNNDEPDYVKKTFPPGFYPTCLFQFSKVIEISMEIKCVTALVTAQTKDGQTVSLSGTLQYQVVDAYLNHTKGKEMEKVIKDEWAESLKYLIVSKEYEELHSFNNETLSQSEFSPADTLLTKTLPDSGQVYIGSSIGGITLPASSIEADQQAYQAKKANEARTIDLEGLEMEIMKQLIPWVLNYYDKIITLEELERNVKSTLPPETSEKEVMNTMMTSALNEGRKTKLGKVELTAKAISKQKADIKQSIMIARGISEEKVYSGLGGNTNPHITI